MRGAWRAPGRIRKSAVSLGKQDVCLGLDVAARTASMTPSLHSSEPSDAQAPSM